MLSYIYIFDLSIKIADLFVSTELIPKRRLKKWIQRPGFGIRKVAILKWIVLGNFLTLAYKKSLLASLIPIRYEDTIDNLYDLDKSGLPMFLVAGNSVTDHIRGDPREMTTRIYKRAIVVPYQFPPPQWALKMYVNVYLLSYQPGISLIKARSSFTSGLQMELQLAVVLLI